MGGELTVKGGTSLHRRVLRPRLRERSAATGKGTITNMGAEHRRDLLEHFPVRRRRWRRTSSGHRSRGRGRPSSRVTHKALLRADPEVEANPENFYDHRHPHRPVDKLEPHMGRARTAPDLSRPVSAHGGKRSKDEGWPRQALRVALIGSAARTASYEDMDSRGCEHRGVQAAKEHGVEGGKIPVHGDAGFRDRCTKPSQRDGQMESLRARSGGDCPRQRVRPVHRSVATRRHQKG